MHKNVTILGPTILVLIAAAIWPVQSTWLERNGDDVFEAHLPLHQDKPLVQAIDLPRGLITNVGVILVPYLGEANGSARLLIIDAQNQVLASDTVDASQLSDDAFTNFALNLKHKGKVYLTIEVDSPRPFLAARTEIDDTGEPSTVSLRIQRRGNVYSAIYDGLKEKPRLANDLGLALLIAVALTGVYFGIKGKALRFKRLKLERWFLVVILIALTATAWRFTLIDEIRGTSGGDAYNFAQISQRIVEQGQFYHPEQKRLPAYPLLISAGLPFTSDYFTIARIINQLAVGLSILLIAILVRQLKQPPFVAVLAALLLAVNRDFIFIPLRPLAYPVQGLLLLLALIILNKSNIFSGDTKPRLLVVAGLIFGLAAQTRQEGLVAVGVLLVATISYLLWKKQWRHALLFATLIIALVLPYFIANAINFGNPFYTAYQDHPVTNPRRSLHEIEDHLRQSWAVLSSTWLPRWRHLSEIKFDKLFIVSVLVAVATLVANFKRVKSRLQKNLNQFFAPLVLAGALVLTLYVSQGGGSAREQVVTWLVILGLIGLIKLIVDSWQKKRFWHFLVLFIVTFIIAGIATWVHPVAKTYVSILPYLAIATAIGINLVLNIIPKKDFLTPIIIFWVMTLPFVPMLASASQNLDFFSRKHVLDYTRYEVARHAQENTQENISVNQLHLPFQLFLKDRVKEDDKEAKLEIIVDITESPTENIQSFWGFDEDDNIVEARIIQR